MPKRTKSSHNYRESSLAFQRVAFYRLLAISPEHGEPGMLAQKQDCYLLFQRNTVQRNGAHKNCVKNIDIVIKQFHLNG